MTTLDPTAVPTPAPPTVPLPLLNATLSIPTAVLAASFDTAGFTSPAAQSGENIPADEVLIPPVAPAATVPTAPAATVPTAPAATVPTAPAPVVAPVVTSDVPVADDTTATDTTATSATTSAGPVLPTDGFFYDTRERQAADVAGLPTTEGLPLNQAALDKIVALDTVVVNIRAWVDYLEREVNKAKRLAGA